MKYYFIYTTISNNVVVVDTTIEITVIIMLTLFLPSYYHLLLSSLPTLLLPTCMPCQAIGKQLTALLSDEATPLRSGAGEQPLHHV
jgi:hypothetical protein